MKYITLEGLQKLKNELKERKSIKRQEIAKRLEEAKGLGDLSENTEYATAKDAQSFNEGRIIELEEMTRNAVVIRPEKNSGKNRVTLGSVVEVRAEGSKSRSKNFLIRDRQVFNIVGSQEAEPSQGKISNESPLGKAFLGHQVGDIIDIETPGRKVRYEIVSIK